MNKKFIIAALLLTPLTAPAQQPKAYLLEREVAVQAITDTGPTSGIITIYRADADPKGKVALVIDGEPTAEKIRNALVLSLGIVFPQPQPDVCNSTSRGEACTGDARGVRR